MLHTNPKTINLYTLSMFSIVEVYRGDTTKKSYTDEETSEVVSRYAWDETSNIANDLGRTVHSVRCRARRLKITKMLPHLRKRFRKEKEFNIAVLK